MNTVMDKPRVDHGWWDAACCHQPDTNPDLWSSEIRAEIATARHICIRHCPVTQQCQADALKHRSNSIVQGGLRWDKHGHLYSSDPAKTCQLCKTTSAT